MKEDTRPTPPLPESEFEEVVSTEEEFEIFRFENLGDNITGKLEKISRVDFGEREQKAYTLRARDSMLYQVMGNTDLNSKMKTVRIGQTVRITFDHDKELGRGLSPQKYFKVEISRASGPAQGGPKSV